MRRFHEIALVASLALIGASFLPWLRLGEVALRGVPDPAGLFVAGLGALGALLSLAGLFARRDVRAAVALVGVAALTTLIVVWRSGPVTVADRAHARAEAVAIVDNVAAPPVPPVRVGAGLLLGVAAAAAIALAGIAEVWRERD